MTGGIVGMSRRRPGSGSASTAAVDGTNGAFASDYLTGIAILLGNGDGTFQTATPISAAASS